MEESKPAIWNPDKALEGVFCPTCGQKLSGWIDGRKHPPELHKTKEL